MTLAPLALGEWRVIPLGTDQRERVRVVTDAAVQEQDTAGVRKLAQAAIERAGPVTWTSARGTISCNTAPDDPRFRDPQALASAALKLVQSMGRAPDPVGSDVLAGPLAVLLKGNGDCLTLSGLLLSVYLALGLRAVMALVSRPCNPDDHVCLVVAIDGETYWADPAGRLPFGRADHGVPCPLPALVQIV